MRPPTNEQIVVIERWLPLVFELGEEGLRDAPDWVRKVFEPDGGTLNFWDWFKAERVRADRMIKVLRRQILATMAAEAAADGMHDNSEANRFPEGR